MPDLGPSLPGYVWDERLGRTGRWRELSPDGRLGRIVSNDDLTRLVADLADASAQRLANLAADAANGLISPAVFEAAMQAELKNMYNACAALGAGGWSELGPAEWGRNGGILRGEYAYLAEFAQALANGELTEAQARARAELYAGKAYSRFWDELARRMRQEAAFEQWHDTGLPGECNDCADLAALGRVPVGTLGTVPGAGDTACLGSCRCSIGWYDAEGNEL